MQRASGPFGTNSKSRALSRREAQEWLKGMDYNGDGEIDYLEFTTAALRIRQRKKRDSIGWDHRIKLAFGRIDHDGNGYIDFREFVLGLNLSNKPLDEKIRWAFRLYDLSQDGLIQRAEIQQVGLKQVLPPDLLSQDRLLGPEPTRQEELREGGGGVR